MPSRHYDYTLVPSIPMSKAWVVSLRNRLMPMEDYFKAYGTSILPLLYYTDSTLLFKSKTTAKRFMLNDKYNIRYYIGDIDMTTIIVSIDGTIIYDDIHSRIDDFYMAPMLWVNLKE